MNQALLATCSFVVLLSTTAFAQSANPVTTDITFGPYEYEVKPDHEAFRSLNPRKAPQPGPLLLSQGDRLAICGDSITQQRMYSRLMETYLTACTPQLEVTVRQYGWSGEKTDGFLRRMDRDCLTFDPTIATLAYGMNDARYRPYDATNGQWYDDHYTAIVRRFKENGVRVVVGSPGCSGKLATWVKSRSGTLAQHNTHLCALRDIAMGVAEREQVRFADIFWPMYQAQVLAPDQHNATEENPYLVAGEDGIHPGWAGHVIMAWSMLRSLGLDGNIGMLSIDLKNETATSSKGHQVESFANGKLKLTSTRYPFCSTGEIDDHNSVRSGLTLVPFNKDLNRLTLKVHTASNAIHRLTWGDVAKNFSAEQLEAGINLAEEFPSNPFSAAFERVSAAVGAKQAYETEQVKNVFRNAKSDDQFNAAVRETESIRQPLATAIKNSMQPVSHSLHIKVLAD